MKPYILDSNFFIEAHRKSYPLDVATSFWAKVKDLAQKGVIISIDKVKNELYKNEDDLKQWCKNNLPDNFFHDTTSSSVISIYSSVIGWASASKQYSVTAKDQFLHADEADAWLVSYAATNGSTIVTSEVSAPLSIKNIKIPDVSKPFGVTTITPIDMFRALGEQF